MSECSELTTANWARILTTVGSVRAQKPVWQESRPDGGGANGGLA